MLPTGHACALQAPPSSALGMSLHALSLLMHARLLADIALHQDHTKLVVLPPPCPLTISPVDFSHAESLITTTLTDARAFLDGAAASTGRRSGYASGHSHPAGADPTGRDQIRPELTSGTGKTPRPADAHTTCA